MVLLVVLCCYCWWWFFFFFISFHSSPFHHVIYGVRFIHTLSPDISHTLHSLSPLLDTFLYIVFIIFSFPSRNCRVIRNVKTMIYFILIAISWIFVVLCFTFNVYCLGLRHYGVVVKVQRLPKITFAQR